MATGVMRSKTAGVRQGRPDYRIVLLGHRGSGKTLVGSSILGTDCAGKPRQTLQCVQTEGEAAGRSVALVEAPGWWKNYPVKDTSELTRREIEISATLCPPGPHAFLLVLQLDSSFTEKHRQVTEEHVGLLGKRAWHHTIVLFVHNNQLEDDVIEQRIGSDREAQHHCLVERCQRRCHVFNIDNKGSNLQVTKLLEKIDEVIAGNNGRHYEVEGKRWRELVEKRVIKAVRGEERMAGQEQREEVGNVIAQRPHLSKLRIILLGSRRAGKSSAGNTILGQRWFGPRRTTQCTRRQGEVAQRQVTVVDTPGWWRGISAVDTPELTKREVVLGASLCPPGPHALLLVHRLDFSFGDDQLKAWEEHVELLFGDGAWAHAIVLFTHGDWLGEGATVEQYMKAEGQALQRLLAKCRGRYHVLNNNNNATPDSKPQVVKLLQKVEGMTMGTGSYYELDRSRARSHEKRKLTVIKKAVQRENQQKQSGMLKLIIGHTLQLSTLRIMLLGYSQSGKSSAGNSILGAEAFDVKHTTLSVRQDGEGAGQWFTVIDTPGWQRSTAMAGTPAWTRQELARAASLCPPGPHALLLVLRTDASFREDEWRVVQEHLKLLDGSGSEQVWAHTLVLFTCADWLGGDATIEQHIESEGEPLQELLDRCGNRYHALDNKTQSATTRTQVTRLLEKVKGMVLLNGGCHLDTGSLFQEGQEAFQPAEIPWISDFQELSDEDRSDDVFLDGPSTERCPLLLPFSRSLTPIPSAEQSLASSSTSITELRGNPEGRGIKFPKFLHLKADREKMSET